MGDHVSLQITAVDADPGTFTDKVNGSDTLPPGLSIDPNSGLITGTIASTAAGTYNVTISASDDSAVGNTSFLWVIPVQTPVDTAVLATDGSLDLFNSNGSPQQISGPGTILAISTAQDSNGVTAVYAITTGAAGAQYKNTLWEFYDGSWSERSSGSFLQISATTSMDGGAVVFGVLTDHSLWEEHVAFGLNTGWAELSTAGSIQSVSAVTDVTGSEWCYAIVQTPGFAGTLWLHGPAFPSGWQELSSGSFQQISAGLNSSGQEIVYGVLSNSQLWEQDQAFGPLGLNSGFEQLSGMGSPALPTSFLSVQAGGPDKVFGIAADRTIWEHSPSGNMQLSPIYQVEQLSATQTLSGADEVFMALTDGNFVEYSSALPNHFVQLFLPHGASAASSSTPE